MDINIIILGVLYTVGLITVTVFFWLGVFAIAGWIGKGVKRVYRHFHPLPPKTEEEIAAEAETEAHRNRFENTWSAGFAVGLEHAEMWRKESDKWFRRYMDAAFPGYSEFSAKRQAEKAAEPDPIESDHAQAQIDTDE